MFEFIETPFFTKAIAHYLNDDEYAALQSALNKNPEAGVVVPGSGGVRKLRWGPRVGESVLGCALSIFCACPKNISGC